MILVPVWAFLAACVLLVTIIVSMMLLLEIVRRL